MTDIGSTQANDESPALRERRAQWDSLADTTYDAAIVGGGINGAVCYHHLASLGYRVLLIDRGDIAGGTSQASAMMIWGGLLYLSTLDLQTVWRLSRARDRLIRDLDGRATLHPRPLPSPPKIIPQSLRETTMFRVWMGRK